MPPATAQSFPLVSGGDGEGPAPRQRAGDDVAALSQSVALAGRVAEPAREERRPRPGHVGDDGRAHVQIASTGGAIPCGDPDHPRPAAQEAGRFHVVRDDRSRRGRRPDHRERHPLG